MKKLLFFVSLCLLLTPVFTFASIDNNLSYGLQNNGDVKQLQEFLVDKGFFNGDATGNFFSITLKAVKAYQASAGINATGYVGILTRTAINSDLANNLSASNQEAISETGTTPLTPETPKTNNDIAVSLQTQISLLTQQLQAMLAQQTTAQQIQQQVQQQTQVIQQIQQNTQQVVQNTTPIATPVDSYPPKVKLPNLGTVSGTIYISRGMDVSQDYGLMPLNSITRPGLLSEAAPLDKLELYLDDKIAPVDYNPYVWMRTASDPGSFALNTLSLSNGNHTLNLKAYDLAGNMGQDTITIDVEN